MNRQRLVRVALASGLVVMLAAGCSKADEVSKSIDPPPTSAEILSKLPTKTIENGQKATLYLRDEKGMIAPVTLNVPKTAEVAKEALSFMVEDGAGLGYLPQGFSAILPKGTQVKGINLDATKKLATVDFTKNFTNYNAQDERKILEAITWTLTSFPSIDKVQIRVEGKDLKEMPEMGTPLDEPLTRAMGINLEKSSEVDYGQGTPVTLYFLSQNKAKVNYYVPVTRMVKRTDNLAQAAVEQLIKGPDAKKGLTSVFAPTLEILDVKKAEDMITVNFSAKTMTPEQKASAEALQSVVLSLAENTGVSKVQFMINGEAKVVTTDNQSFAKPVTKPVSINQIKM